MFSRRKRGTRAAAGESELADAVLKRTANGYFMLDAKRRLIPPVSPALAALFRRQDFTNLTLERLLAPLVGKKALNDVIRFLDKLVEGAALGEPVAGPLNDLEVRLANPDGSIDTAHYCLDFELSAGPEEPPLWLVQVSDITQRLSATRELEELRSQVQTQGEILRAVLRMGGTRFGGFMQKTDASMKTIAAVLKKPAREEDAFRHKLEEILDEVDRVRREAAAFKLSGLELAARLFEDALHDLRSRRAMSGSDFLPLAVKLDHLYDQFALVKSLTIAAAPAREAASSTADARMTDNGTQIIEAPKFLKAYRLDAPSSPPPPPSAQQSAPAGSLGSTLQAVTEHVAQLHDKNVVLESSGLHLVPPQYQSAVKNVAIQLIRNAVMHGIEPPQVREAAKKPSRGTLRLDFALRNGCYELKFEDDGCGLDPQHVRATAVERGVIGSEAAARLRDREAIKLIFKSRFTTLAASASDTTHGAGLSLVRRYVHDAGGKIALASRVGHETRFKITFASLEAPAAQSVSGTDASAAPAAAAPPAMPPGPEAADAAADPASGDVRAA